MCGIISGCLLDEKFFLEYRKFITNLFFESKIRGKHSSGLSYGKSEINTFVLPIASDKFIHKKGYKKAMNHIKEEPIIGHIRYSTSDLHFNQPIQIRKNFSIVHNGVITQREFVFWKEDYKDLLNGYELKTKNDTELLGISFYRYLKGEKKFNPFFYFKKSSIACSILYKGRIYFFRNGKRPLYYYKDEKFFLLASTKDIFLRAGLKEKYIKKVKPFVLYKFFKNNIKMKKFEINKKDLQ